MNKITKNSVSIEIWGNKNTVTLMKKIDTVTPPSPTKEKTEISTANKHRIQPPLPSFPTFITVYNLSLRLWHAELTRRTTPGQSKLAELLYFCLFSLVRKSWRMPTLVFPWQRVKGAFHGKNKSDNLERVRSASTTLGQSTRFISTLALLGKAFAFKHVVHGKDTRQGATVYREASIGSHSRTTEHDPDTMLSLPKLPFLGNNMCEEWIWLNHGMRLDVRQRLYVCFIPLIEFI